MNVYRNYGTNSMMSSMLYLYKSLKGSERSCAVTASHVRNSNQVIKLSAAIVVQRGWRVLT